MEFYYVIYTSSPARIMSDADLQHLLKTAREANPRYDVTGMLVCLPECYIQLIEGPKQQIDQLYQNIQRDDRHLRVTTLREGFISDRYFPDWAMAFKKLDMHEDEGNTVSLQDDRVLQLFDILEY